MTFFKISCISKYHSFYKNEFIFSITNYKNQLFQFLFAVIPAISFIAGNMIININVILIILSSLILFNKNFLNLEFLLIDKLIFLYFFLILISGISSMT